MKLQSDVSPAGEASRTPRTDRDLARDGAPARDERLRACGRAAKRTVDRACPDVRLPVSARLLSLSSSRYGYAFELLVKACSEDRLRHALVQAAGMRRASPSSTSATASILSVWSVASTMCAAIWWRRSRTSIRTLPHEDGRVRASEGMDASRTSVWSRAAPTSRRTWCASPRLDSAYSGSGGAKRSQGRRSSGMAIGSLSARVAE